MYVSRCACVCACLVFTINCHDESYSKEGNLVLNIFRGSMTSYPFEITVNTLNVNFLPPYPVHVRV